MNSITPNISTTTYLAILFLSFAGTGLLYLFNTEVRRYWQSAFRHRGRFLMLLFAMAAPFLGGGRTIGGEDGQGIVRWIRFIVIIIIFMVSMNSILRMGRNRTPMGNPARWLLIYALVCMASATYSVDPTITIWKSFEVLSLIVAGVYICGKVNNWDNVQDVLNMLYLLIVFFCVSTLAGALISPGAAFLSQSSGISLRGLAPAINSNSVSQWGMLLATITLARVLSKNYSGAKASLWVLFGIGMSVALLGHSRTALFAGALAIIVLLIFGRHYKTAAFTSLTALIVLLFGTLSEGITTYITRGQDADLFLSMSNRTYFWELAIQAWSERPILGYGFYSGQRVILGWSTVDNAYLEVAVGTGIIGLLAFSAAPISASLLLLRSVPRKLENIIHMSTWLQLMSIFTIIFLRSFTSTSFSGLHPNTVIFVVSTSLIAAMYRLQKMDTNTPVNTVKPKPDAAGSRIFRKRR